MYPYDDIPPDTPYEWFWIVDQNGLVKRAKAYRVADAFPEAEARYKWDMKPSSGWPIEYDPENPWYIVPDGPYQTTKRFVYETAAAACLAALDRWRKTQERQRAILASVEEALDSMDR